MKVYQAINAVQASLSKLGIGKTERNEFDKYNFRGIDSVYNALAPLLSEHGLVILPRVISRECAERASKSGGALFYVTLLVEYDFICASDGSKHTVASYGEAMDRGDKATNKAMSAAYKYACFQAFCIPTEAHDADAETHEVKPEPKVVGITPTGGVWDALDTEEQAFLLSIAERVCVELDQGFTTKAVELIKAEKLTADEQIALWTRFTAPQRSAMKKAASSLKQAA